MLGARWTAGCAHTLIMLQVLFALGVLGELWLGATQNGAVTTFVAEHPWSTVLIGPAFAAVTGVAIKEGLCYGKAEAAALALVGQPHCTLHQRHGIHPLRHPLLPALMLLSGHIRRMLQADCVSMAELRMRLQWHIRASFLA